MAKSVRKSEKELKSLRKSVTGMVAERKRKGKSIPAARPGTSLYRSQQRMIEKQKRLKKFLK